MRFISLLPVAAVLLLAACGDSAEDSPAGVEGAAEAMADGPTPQPGQYSTTTEILELTIPGLAPEMRDMIRSAMAEGAREGSSYCLTAEDAANSREEMIRNMTESDCTVQRFDMAGGTIDASLSCPAGGEGLTGDVTLNGTMTETGADMTMSFKSQVPDLGEATIRMRMVSSRVGDC
ncbi:DUF3617 domain-containing protein [Alteraurantiacibacter palmitatis]|uniref:DUF3617 domain-containing protein n=1 Tax=Alteraurantiacibacter palmitatis TaxID=2054628 RepID=A0ABV7EA49_9SPHN